MGGKTGVRLALRNLPKTLVEPAKGTPKQPAYIRGGVTVASSARLLKFRSCIAAAMKGKGGDRVAIRNAFGSAAKACAGKT